MLSAFFASGYDSVRRELVVFGGQTTTTIFDDTWVLSLETLRWRNVTASTAIGSVAGTPVLKPSARFAMVYCSWTVASVLMMRGNT